MKQIRAWLPAILWMGVIYMMSAMPGDISGAQSGQIARLLRGALSLVLGARAQQIPEDVLQLFVRKGAHMAEYAILFVLDWRALRRTGARHPGSTALLLCAAYAATDEFHQSFVGGRRPSIIDVGIDTLGAGLGWGAVKLGCSAIRHAK